VVAERLKEIQPNKQKIKTNRINEMSTPSIDAYLFEEHPRQIASRSDLKRQSPRFFKDGRRIKKKKNNNNKIGRVMRAVPDLKNKCSYYRYTIY